MKKQINTFDIDGVISLDGKPGIRPHNGDVIITGRSIEESKETFEMLAQFDISNAVMFNEIPFDEKTRVSSGIHKGKALLKLIESGFEIGIHYEDDIVQIEEIKKIVGDKVFICHVNTNGLVELENKRHV